MMVPKTWAVFTDAVDAGAGHAARRAREIVRESQGPEDFEMQQDRVAEVIRQEIVNAVCERFDFVDPEGE